MFALLPERGHVNPFIGVAQALVDAGHEVVVVSPGDISEQITRAGLTFSRDLLGAGEGAPPPSGKALIELLEDRARYRSFIEGFVVHSVPAQVGPMQGYLERVRPDVVVLDPMYYGAAIAAHRCGVRWCAVSTALSQVVTPEIKSEVITLVTELAPKRAAVFAAHGFPQAQFRGADVLSPYLNVTFATEQLVGRAPEGIALVGPSRPLRERGDEVPFDPIPPELDDRPVVYASLGSQVFHYPEIFEKIAEACGALGAFAALSVGELALEPRWASFGRARNAHDMPGAELGRAYRYAPQAELLKRAAVFITHGGANSVMEGLSAGVPLLVTPLCNDQFHQAYFVEKAGVGLVVDLRRASVDNIRQTLARLLDDQKIHDAVKAVAESYRANGALEAARLVSSI